jgi:hypothetical protein
MFSRVLPTFVIVVEMPEEFDPSQGRTRMNARQNTAVKEAIKVALLYHHKKVMRRHFMRDAKTKYRHYKRAESTNRRKAARGRYRDATGSMQQGPIGRAGIDLVKSGTARDHFKSQTPKIRVGGKSYSGGQITGTMTLTWPPGYYDNTKASPDAVTKKKMTEELSRWTRQDTEDVKKKFAEAYARELKRRTSPRIRKRYEARFAALGG